MATSDEQRAAALATFTDYFVKNYPGPTTIIHDPYWHAPKIFRAAEYALQATAHQQAPQERAEVFEPAFRALDRIGDAPDEIWRRREAEVACFYAVQQYRAALAANPQQITGESDSATGAATAQADQTSQVAHPDPQQSNDEVSK